MEKLKFYPNTELQPVWTEQDLRKFMQALNNRYHDYLQQEEFLLSAYANKMQIQLSSALQKKDQSQSYPIELICVYADYPEFKLQEVGELLLAFLESYWDEYFAQERDIFFPIDWASYQYAELSFFLRGFVRNLSLEQQAEQLLQAHGHGEYDILAISSET